MQAFLTALTGGLARSYDKMVSSDCVEESRRELGDGKPLQDFSFDIGGWVGLGQGTDTSVVKLIDISDSDAQELFAIVCVVAPCGGGNGVDQTNHGRDRLTLFEYRSSGLMTGAQRVADEGSGVEVAVEDLVVREDGVLHDCDQAGRG